MIEKKINYCWFGGKTKPDSVVKCIESWQKFFPDYEIIEWNESNFNIDYCSYVHEAYLKKKWAFVSDVARLVVVYENGGIYFDTDVEIVKPFGDIINQKFYLGQEEPGRINTGVGFGAEKGSPVIKAMIDVYKDAHFISQDGGMKPLVCPVYNTKAIVDLGLKFEDGIICFMGGSIYPPDYFSPKGLKDGVLRITDNTRSIHHFDNSWMTKSQRVKKCMARGFIGEKILLPLWHFLKKFFNR